VLCWQAPLEKEEQQVHRGSYGQVTESDSDSLYRHEYKADSLPVAQKLRRYAEIPTDTTDGTRALDPRNVIDRTHGQLIPHNSKLSTRPAGSCQGCVVEMSPQCHRSAPDFPSFQVILSQTNPCRMP
jgi:hypothetical protein